jgi:hypothetical protein
MSFSGRRSVVVTAVRVTCVMGCGHQARGVARDANDVEFESENRIA